jgi:hypothetical protein
MGFPCESSTPWFVLGEHPPARRPATARSAPTSCGVEVEIAPEDFAVDGDRQMM